MARWRAAASGETGQMNGQTTALGAGGSNQPVGADAVDAGGRCENYTLNPKHWTLNPEP